jgi:hypothetical protein
MTESTGTLCEYRVLENDIHEFVMLDFSRAGVDAFIEALKHMNSTPLSGHYRPILVDSGGGVQPMNYMFQRLRTLPTAPARHHFKVAMLLQPGIVGSIVGTMVRVFPRLNVRLFLPHERQAAMDWLLSGTQPSGKLNHF